jgi:hypothetical protein
MNWWSTIGLVLDIAGVWLVFMYGLPSKVDEGMQVQYHELDVDPRARKKGNKRIVVAARLGLALITVGFILQMLGSNQVWAAWLSE